MSETVVNQTIESGCVEDTMAVGETVARVARAGDCIALIGELGAGKTQFVRGLARGLGIDPARVSSPTFVCLQEYNTSDSDHAIVLVHVDAYRLSGADDLASIGWEGDGEELRRGAVLVVEWADRITPALCADRLEVRITHHGEGRTLILTPHGSWQSRMPKLPGHQQGTKCPICDKPVATDAANFPFCCDRCKKIDLGNWLNGAYLISRPVEESDLDEGE